MHEDTVEISLEARHRLAIEKAYKEGVRDGWEWEEHSCSIHFLWQASDTKRAMES